MDVMKSCYSWNCELSRELAVGEWRQLNQSWRLIKGYSTTSPHFGGVQ